MKRHRIISTAALSLLLGIPAVASYAQDPQRGEKPKQEQQQDKKADKKADKKGQPDKPAPPDKPKDAPPARPPQAQPPPAEPQRGQDRRRQEREQPPPQREPPPPQRVAPPQRDQPPPQREQPRPQREQPPQPPPPQREQPPQQRAQPRPPQEQNRPQQQRDARVSQQRQQELVQQQQQRLTQYQKDLDRQQQIVQQQAAQLQQQRRTAQSRNQQAYLNHLREQRTFLVNGRHPDYDRDPYFFSPPIYRYSRGGRYYEANQYAADFLRQAVNFGYQQGFMAGDADRMDNWRPDYQASYAYQDANYGYNGYYIERDDYNFYFREGFRRGYEDGYGNRHVYGRYEGGSHIMLELNLGQILGFVSIR
jgi:outer membrane biosynthesis protein TonB